MADWTWNTAWTLGIGSLIFVFSAVADNETYFPLVFLRCRLATTSILGNGLNGTLFNTYLSKRAVCNEATLVLEIQ